MVRSIGDKNVAFGVGMNIPGAEDAGCVRGNAVAVVTETGDSSERRAGLFVEDRWA